MIEVQVTANDRQGNALFFVMGMGRSFAAAKAAAAVGMRARLAADRSLVSLVRTFTVEAL
jgi:hypothetical protein